MSISAAHLEMPNVGFGTFNNFNAPDEVGAAVTNAINAGYRHFDCAELYSNEVEIGQALTASDVKREELYIVSKAWNHHHEPAELRKACERSIAALQCDYLDCYLIHWPVNWVANTVPEMLIGEYRDKVMVGDPSPVSLEETWASMEDLVKDGLVRHIGLSNFGPASVDRILKVSTMAGPYCNQVELHPHLAQAKLLDHCNAHNIKVVAYHPLGKPGARKEGEPVAIQDPTITAIAAKHAKTPAQCILRWEIQRGIYVIPKSTTPSRIQENLAVLDFELSKEEMDQICELDAGVRFCAPSWCDPHLYST